MIGPNVSIAAGVTITDSIVADSIVGEGARIETATLSSSLIGERAVVIGHRARMNVGDDSQVMLD